MGQEASAREVHHVVHGPGSPPGDGDMDASGDGVDSQQRCGTDRTSALGTRTATPVLSLCLHNHRIVHTSASLILLVNVS